MRTYTSLKIYSKYGDLDARSYHAKCRVCKVLYYHGFHVDKVNGIHVFDKPSGVEDTLIFNGGVGFSRDIMKTADNIICIGGVSFEKTAEILNETYSFNTDRLEGGWFIYRILEFVQTIK